MSDRSILKASPQSFGADADDSSVVIIRTALLSALVAGLPLAFSGERSDATKLIPTTDEAHPIKAAWRCC